MSILNADLEPIVKQRLEQKFASGQMHDVYILGIRYSPKDQIDAVRDGSSVGEEIMLMEARLMNYLKSKI